MTEAGDIFAAPRPRVFSIDAGRPFLKELARTIAALSPDDPLALADVEILLPTRRAARALDEAFVELREGRASLLPRIRPIGDLEEDAIALEAERDFDLPPAISPLERRLALARLVAAADRAFSGQENWPAALSAAEALASLLDDFYTEERSFAALADLVPAQHAEHWERSLRFLRIVTEAWPAHLEGRGLMDPTQRRAILIDREAKRLAAARPQHPVIIAGTTGSAPAVARLIRTIADLPKGAAILPGLDRALAADAKAWRAIEDAHPQAGLKALLKGIGVAPGDVALIPRVAPETPRARLLSLALRPADATDDWLALVDAARADDPGLTKACKGLSLFEAADEEEEATGVAILLREALETPGRTAALVTPDRDLGRRVAAKMRRWNVAVDDSAGVPFGNSPCGTYLRLVAHWLVAPADPHAALSLARAPLAGFGLDESRRRRAVGAFDRALRGLAPQNMNALAQKVAASQVAERAAPVADALTRAAKNWPGDGAHPFPHLLDAHLAAAEALAADDAEGGAARLWRGEDGEAGALLLAGLRESADALGSLHTRDYPQALSKLFAGAVVRRRTPAHPRIAILGPLEARLQSADLIILGGLNEGVWPGDAGADPFLSRAMREAAGLTSLERRIGLSTHDFAEHAASGNVVLTRAARSGGAPAKPSRWIVRLRNILAGAKALPAVDCSSRLAAWARLLDEAGPPRRASPPRPTPPVDARPRALSVTRVEKWLRNPYSIYAQYILRLPKLDSVGEPFGARHLGTLLHKVFERAVQEGADTSTLARILDEEAEPCGLGPAERAFWGPAIDDALAWFLDFHAGRAALGAPAVIEGRGAAMFEGRAGPFELSARADRIDLERDGRAYIFDYKSASIPTSSQMEKFRMQLPLTALIVEKGGFAELGPRRVAGFQYLRSLNRKEKGNETGAEGGDAVEMTRRVSEGFREWIAAYDDPNTPYLSQPRPEFVDDYSDYDHLARRHEREIGGEE